MVEDDDVVDTTEIHDVLVAIEVQIVVELVVLVVNDVHEVQPFDVMVENDDAEKVIIIVAVVVDDEVVVDDDYTEMVVMVEMVDITDQVKCTVVNDEKVEILVALGVVEMVVQSEMHIHEMVEKVVIDEIDGFDETDLIDEKTHEMHHEFDEKEFYVVEMVDILIIDELVEMQLLMFTDSI